MYLPAISECPPDGAQAPVLIFGLLQHLDPHVRNGHSHAVIKAYPTFIHRSGTTNTQHQLYCCYKNFFWFGGLELNSVNCNREQYNYCQSQIFGEWGFIIVNLFAVEQCRATCVWSATSCAQLHNFFELQDAHRFDRQQPHHLIPAKCTLHCVTISADICQPDWSKCSCQGANWKAVYQQSVKGCPPPTPYPKFSFMWLQWNARNVKNALMY